MPVTKRSNGPESLTGGFRNIATPHWQEGVSRFKRRLEASASASWIERFRMPNDLVFVKF